MPRFRVVIVILIAGLVAGVFVSAAAKGAADLAVRLEQRQAVLE